MKVLVIGSGGREHAIVWKIAQSQRVKKIYCAPGNAGIRDIAECVPIAADDIASLLDFAVKEKIDLTVVGPEVPLVLGIVDEFMKKGLRVFGPQKLAAELEGSKKLAKEIMVENNIPTAKYDEFTDSQKAIDYIKTLTPPIVIKADGLAAGKGVVISATKEDAIDAVKSMMEEKIFGDAGAMIIIEEFLDGEEASLLAFTDGETVIPMVSSQDHKRIFDGDEGPNTGGMGAYSPAPVATKGVRKQIADSVLTPIVRAMKAKGREYKGVIYAGLIFTKEGPKVLEFNVRFGDPETQVILPRLKTDLVDIMEAVIDGRLNEIEVEWYPERTVGVVIASGGYPGSYEKGIKITGIAEAEKIEGVSVFHAGTELKDDDVVTAGGRVLVVVGEGDTYEETIEKVYDAVEKIYFDGMHYRRDIAQRALNRL